MFFLHEFICIIGLTKSILAPVVPIQLEKKSSNSKHDNVYLWVADQTSLQLDISGYAEQSKEQHDKGQIVAYQTLQYRLYGFWCSIEQRERNGKKQ